MPQLKPRDVVIVDCARTAITHPTQGVFRHLHAEQLSARLISALLQRQPFDHHDIDDLIVGCATQEQQQSQNLARRIGLLAQLPVHVAAQTVNRLTGSSMQALHTGAAQIMADQADVILVAGVEHRDLSQQKQLALAAEHGKYYPSLAHQTAHSHDLLARMYDISREEQDQMALHSQQKARHAQQQGWLKNQMIALEGQLNDESSIWSAEDSYIQTEPSLAILRQQPHLVSGPFASITSSNSAPQASAASAMLIMSNAQAQKYGLTPRAVIRSMTTAGCDPATSAFGLVVATQKALYRTGLKPEHIGAFELHEASASQYLTAIHALALSEHEDNINRYGGAIALGDPIGATGLQLLISLLHTIEQQQTQFGLASLSIPLGQGMCTIIERI